MEIAQLRYFLEICSVGSMVKAADRLHITQQGISIAIRRLEDELGRDLFFHKSKALVLTEFGAAFRDEAQIVITHVDRLYELSRSDSVDGKANISVAISRHRITKLPPALQQLLVTPPDEYRVNVINDYSISCVDMVLDGSVTFGLVYGDFSDKSLDCILLEKVQQVFVVNKSSPFASRDSVSIKDLDGVPLLVPDSTTVPTMTIASMFKENNAKMNVVFECNFPHQAVEIASANPNIVARSLYSDITPLDYENIHVLRLEDNDFCTPFCLLSKHGRKLTVHEQLFKHLILDCYRDHVDYLLPDDTQHIIKP